MENIENKSFKNLILSNKKKLLLLAGVKFLSLIYFWWADNIKKKDRSKERERGTKIHIQKTKTSERRWYD